jgi:polyisoprenoid-binding protein YceI
MINIIKYFSLGILFIICISCNAEETVPQTVININTNTNSENTEINESHSNFSVELNQNSSAEYQVTETFADVPNPVKAIGKTNSVSGQIKFDNNQLNPVMSVIKIDLRNLTSDSGRRDNYIKRRTLDTATYPYAEFQINNITGLPMPITTGEYSDVVIEGKLKIKEIESDTLWRGNIIVKDNVTSGKFKTTISFDQYKLTKPLTFRVISVENEFDLVIDFNSDIKKE